MWKQTPLPENCKTGADVQAFVWAGINNSYKLVGKDPVSQKAIVVRLNWFQWEQKTKDGTLLKDFPVPAPLEQTA